MGNRARRHVLRSQQRLLMFLVLVGVAALLAACGGTTPEATPQRPAPATARGPTATATRLPTLAPTATAAAPAGPTSAATPEPTAPGTPTEPPSRTPTSHPTSRPTRSRTADFGDAPDGIDAGYPAGAVRAQFPSLLASDGARIRNPGPDTLGLAVDSETDARASNGDAADDGVTGLVVNLDAARILANLALMVTVAEGAPEGPRYLNVLIDLDQDGAWGGSSGGQSEWVVNNVAVDVAPGTTVRADPPAFGFGAGDALPAAAWMRVLLTRQPLARSDWDGSGAFEFGEVEDYLVVMPESPAPLVRCESPLAMRGVFLRPFTCEVTNLSAAGDVGLAFDAGASALPVLARETVLPNLATGQTRSITGLAFNAAPNAGFVALTSVGDAPPASVADGRVTPLLQPGQWTQGASDEAAPNGLTLTDDRNDLFHGDPTIAAVRADGSVDIQFWGSGTIDLAGERAGDILGSEGILSCRRRFVTAGPTVFCGPDEPEPALYRVVWMSLADVVPLIDETLVRTYWVMFQDGDPDNDFKALPQFANDVLGGSDVHYWLQSDGLMWALRRTEGPNLRDTETRAFAVLSDEVVAFFIPRTEISPRGDDSFGVLPLIADFPGTGVGVAAFSGPATDPFGLEATSDRAPGAQEPLLDVGQATRWDLVYDELAPPLTHLAEAAPPLEIVAEDGGARLLIPPSALPAGVSENDIRISRIESGDFAGTLDGAAPLVAYRLEPDGLALRAPAAIEVTTEFVGQDVPLLIHVAGDSVEPARNQFVEIDAIAGVVTVSGEIEHFSEIDLDTRGHFKAVLTTPSSAAVGETFNVNVTLSKTNNPFQLTYAGGPRTYTFRALDPWHAGGSLETRGSFVSLGEPLRPNPLLPEEIRRVPPPLWRRQPSVSAGGSFTCVEVGDGTITFSSKILFSEATVLEETSNAGARTVVGRSVEGAIAVVVVSIAVECHAPLAGGTGTTGVSFPKIGALVVTLDPPFTTYVVKIPPKDALTFKWQWFRSANACGNFRATRNVATWYHPHSEETGCSLGTSHPGTVAVVYSQDGKFGMKRYEGTQTGRVP